MATGSHRIPNETPLTGPQRGGDKVLQQVEDLIKLEEHQSSCHRSSAGLHIFISRVESHLFISFGVEPVPRLLIGRFFSAESAEPHVHKHTYRCTRTHRRSHNSTQKRNRSVGRRVSQRPPGITHTPLTEQRRRSGSSPHPPLSPDGRE